MEEKAEGGREGRRESRRGEGLKRSVSDGGGNDKVFGFDCSILRTGIDAGLEGVQQRVVSAVHARKNARATPTLHWQAGSNSSPTP